MHSCMIKPSALNEGPAVIFPVATSSVANRLVSTAGGQPMIVGAAHLQLSPRITVILLPELPTAEVANAMPMCLCKCEELQSADTRPVGPACYGSTMPTRFSRQQAQADP